MNVKTPKSENRDTFCPPKEKVMNLFADHMVLLIC